MIRLYVPEAAPPIVSLPAGEAHHVTRVLRLQPGDPVLVFDGRGREWAGHLASVARGGASVALEAERAAVAEPPVTVTLGSGLLKGDRMDAVVRDATALGVSAIVPVVSSHVALPPRAREQRSVERWQRVAIAAAKQCGRAVVPSIEPPVELAALVRRTVADARRVICCVEPARGGGAPLATTDRPSSALLLTGPEGGWSEEEVEQCRGVGATLLDLGPRTLRAELAPTVALSLLWSAWGWR
ncbi:MAG: 16S rRNA (uracil(1498)-N(3))-methyltransferase [Acidobacteria bacterium]|nr:16S rRNA (uracil(1498)-N(3))-methyltransferase [Acidobacteriota bacterium]